MKYKINWLILSGVLIVIFGITTLFDTLNLTLFGGLLLIVLFAFGGLVFIFYHFQNRNIKWAIIPGAVLIGSGFNILMSAIFPKFTAGNAISFLMGLFYYFPTSI